MEPTFYIAGGIAAISAVMMLTRLNLVHALLYLIVSLLAVAVVFFVLGAPFVAALEAIVYAGAIMVLFLFVVMMLNIGRHAAEMERLWLTPGIWTGPVILTSILIVEVVYLARGASAGLGAGATGPKQVGIALFGPYMIGVELASMLLLAGWWVHITWASAKPKNRRFDVTQVPMRDGLILAGILFSLGLTGLLVRRNLIFVLMSLEVMLNAAGLAFVVAGSRWHQPDGQVMFVFTLTMAAAEVAVGLALVLQIYHRFKSLMWMPSVK
jgi:NADH-quinone oxidoreductase subunit J